MKFWPCGLNPCFGPGELYHSLSACRLADKIGGKRALIISTVAFTLSSTALGFVNDYWSYIAGSFIVGIASLGAHGIAYVYMTEVLGKSYLFFMPTIMNFRVGGSVLYGVVAYFAQVRNVNASRKILVSNLSLIQDWRKIWWYAAFINVLSIPFWFLLTESPRWLLSKGK